MKAALRLRNPQARQPPPAGGQAARPQEQDATLALYEQVKLFILRNIQDETWRPGHRLPSEHELVALLGISRMTIHRALRELTEQRRIIRVAGVGSFVAERRPQSTLLRVGSIANEIRERGHDYRFELVVAERVAASPEIAMGLDLRLSDSVFHTVCIHRENDVPVQLEDRYVNPRVVPRFLDQKFSRISPSEWLMRTVPYDEIEHIVDAVLPDPSQAQQMEMPLNEPCLLLTRRTWTRSVPVTMVRCLHPASRYRLGNRFRLEGHPSIC